ncbi:GPN-loop GTPase 2 [Quaeritorhiza haematococci]|nr:GPN-loop GTPase 2 [Quaeritorhiza haematococci]
MMTALGRSVAIVNLDPANEGIPYKCDIDVGELIKLEEVMDEFGLGPNGGLIYCMEYLEKNIDWLLEKMDALKDKYIIFDCPGQVELYTHNMAVKNVIDVLVKRDYRLCVVHLVDAFHCVDPTNYIAMLLLSLKTMIQLELPHVNILSKVDMVEAYGRLGKDELQNAFMPSLKPSPQLMNWTCLHPLPPPHHPAFNLDFYTEVLDLSYLLQQLNTSHFGSKYVALNKAMCDLVEDFGLVGFYTLCIEDKESVLNVIRVVDKANGYVFGGLEQGNESIFMTAARVGGGYLEDLRDVEERYMMKDWGVGGEEEGEGEGEGDDGEMKMINDRVQKQQEDVEGEYEDPRFRPGTAKSRVRFRLDVGEDEDEGVDEVEMADVANAYGVVVGKEERDSGSLRQSSMEERVPAEQGRIT